MIKIWIYRPDLRQKVDPYLCYNAKGQCFGEWQKEQETVYQFKVEEAKKTVEARTTPNRHYVKEYWP